MAAMSTILDMSLSPFEVLADYERRSLAHVAGLPEQMDAPGSWRGIGFRVSGRHLVSSISEINEILRFPILTPVPGTRPWLLGVANIRGNLLAVIDLKFFLENERTVVADKSRVLLVKQSGGNVGLLVDEVVGQRNFSDEQKFTAPMGDDARYQRFVVENYQLANIPWGLFSMNALVKTPEFIQAAI